MFEDFLYLLRKNGLKVSLTEWMALVEAMDKGLHSSSFTGFYHLCRCLLVKSEADFDTFDRCFLEYFKDVPFQQEVSQELLDWLNRPEVLSDYASWDEEQALKNLGFSEEEIERMRREGVDPEVFMLVKNQMYGELLGDVEAVDDAAEEAAAACLKGRTLADEIAALAALTVEDANALLQTALREENRAYVQIDPAEK